METKFNLNDKVKIIGSGLGCLTGTCGLVEGVHEVRRKIGYRVKMHPDRPSTFFWEDELELVVPEPKFKKKTVYKVAFHSKFAGEVLISIGYYESLEQFIKENAVFTDATILPWTAKEE